MLSLFHFADQARHRADVVEDRLQLLSCDREDLAGWSRRQFEFVPHRDQEIGSAVGGGAIELADAAGGHDSPSASLNCASAAFSRSWTRSISAMNRRSTSAFVAAPCPIFHTALSIVERTFSTHLSMRPSRGRSSSSSTLSVVGAAITFGFFGAGCGSSFSAWACSASKSGRALP